MAVIDIGSPAIDRAGFTNQGKTRILADNTANASGTLDTFEVWAISGFNPINTKIGTFSGTPPNLTVHDFESIGTITGGSKQTFSGLDCDVEIGDFLGAYWEGSEGRFENDATGFAGKYWKSGDFFGAGQTEYALEADATFSLYGTGETAGWAGGDIGVVPIANIAKISGVALADILKVSGVS